MNNNSADIPAQEIIMQIHSENTLHCGECGWGQC